MNRLFHHLRESSEWLDSLCNWFDSYGLDLLLWMLALAVVAAAMLLVYLLML
ncbi:MAG: hypothetical protein II864_04960 [Prevotella sp.]|nr:hypothetical protein [Prevotella sp.]MBR0050023.1 hypothetical protein [Prevotella sp.]